MFNPSNYCLPFPIYYTEWPFQQNEIMFYTVNSDTMQGQTFNSYAPIYGQWTQESQIPL
jgi:hypothetical protein